ncbi:MAG: SPASM domain-containing protein, partial [bacterium]
EYAKKNIPCVQTFTSSNCYRMTEEKYPDILEYIDTLRISFYGMTKEVYEKLHRGNLEFERSLFNVLNFLQYKKEHPDAKKPWVISQMLIIDGINDHQVEDFKEFWEPRTDELIMWRPHNFGGLRGYRGEINHSKQVSCGRPINGPAYVHVDGIVSMCCWDINERLVIGDLNTQTLEEVFHSEPYEMIRQRHVKRDFRGIYCYGCEQTNPAPSCLVYTNKDRKLCTMTSDRLAFSTGENKNG